VYGSFALKYGACDVGGISTHAGPYNYLSPVIFHGVNWGDWCVVHSGKRIHKDQRVLDLANLREIGSAREVENLFRDEPLFKEVPVWRTLDKNDTKDFEGMRKNVRSWLETAITGTTKSAPDY
jgi:hypothetical protein